MSFFKNVGTESAMLCKKLADFNKLKTVEASNTGTWPWTTVVGNAVYIMSNKSTCAVVRYLLDSKRIDIDDLINYVYRPTYQSQYDRETIKKRIDYNLRRIAVKIYNSETKTLYCYGGPKGGMTDKHAELVYSDAIELLTYLNIKYIKKGSSKQHNTRIILI